MRWQIDRFCFSPSRQQNSSAGVLRFGHFQQASDFMHAACWSASDMLHLRAMAAAELADCLDISALDDIEVLDYIATLLNETRLLVEVIPRSVYGVGGSAANVERDLEDEEPAEEPVDLQPLTSGSIIKACWDRRRCCHGDTVGIHVECSPTVADGSAIEIKLFERDAGGWDDLVSRRTNGIVRSRTCNLRHKMDWFDHYEPEGDSYEFYFTAALKSDKGKPARSGLLYVDLARVLAI